MRSWSNPDTLSQQSKAARRVKCFEQFILMIENICQLKLYNE